MSKSLRINVEDLVLRGNLLPTTVGKVFLDGESLPTSVGKRLLVVDSFSTIGESKKINIKLIIHN